MTKNWACTTCNPAITIPAWAASTPPDAFASTGQGLLGNNMYAYCRNNPVSRRDATGTEDETAIDCTPNFDEDKHWGSSSTGADNGGIPTGGSNGAGGSGIYGGHSNGKPNGKPDGKQTTAYNNEEYTDISGTSSYSNTSNRTFLPDKYYANKKAPKFSTPNSSYTNYRYNSYTGKYERSTAYYDSSGRQHIRIDWTNHGYSDHGYPHTHFTDYDAQCPDGISWRID